MTEPITAEQFDKMFDDGKDITPYLAMDSVQMHPPAFFVCYVQSSLPC